MVLIHGNSLDRSVWSGQLGAAELAHLQLIALDLPGHGDGKWYPGNRAYTLESLANDVAAEVIALDAPILVGHSLGGHIAMRVLDLVPGIRGLALIGTPPLTSAADFARAFHPHPSLGNAFKAHLTSEEAHTLAAAWTLEGSAHTESLRETILAADPRMREGLGSQIGQGGITDEQAMIRKSSTPVRLFMGADDPFIQRAFVDVLAPALFAGGAVNYIPDAGHCPQLQCPTAFNTLLAEFERSLP